MSAYCMQHGTCIHTPLCAFYEEGRGQLMSLEEFALKNAFKIQHTLKVL